MKKLPFILFVFVLCHSCQNNKDIYLSIYHDDFLALKHRADSILSRVLEVIDEDIPGRHFDQEDYSFLFGDLAEDDKVKYIEVNLGKYNRGYLSFASLPENPLDLDW